MEAIARIGKDTANFIPCLFDGYHFVDNSLDNNEHSYLGYIGGIAIEAWCNYAVVTFEILGTLNVDLSRIKDIIEERLSKAFINSSVSYQLVTDEGRLLEYNILLA